MHRFFLLLAIGMVIIGQSLHAYCDHSTRRTDNSLIPDFSFQVTPFPISSDLAYCISAEAGRRNYRGSGTLAYSLGEWGLVKVTAEYLTQKLGYAFSNGIAHRYVDQVAAGAAYRKDLCVSWIPFLEAIQGSVYGSHAFNRSVGHFTCPGFSESFDRRIAGSHAVSGTFGATCIPWESGRLQLQTTYDYISFDRKFRHHKVKSGFGSIFSITQCVTRDLDLELDVEFRKPYSYYIGSLNWRVPYGNWRGLAVGAFASYTQGRYGVPNNTCAGIQLSYVFGNGGWSDCLDYDWSCFTCGLTEWVSDPAMYVPEVLAIADQSRRGSSE